MTPRACPVPLPSFFIKGPSNFPSNFNVWRRKTPSCVVCQKTAGEDCDIKQCSACKTRRYCSIKCQGTDWPTHRQECSKVEKWYDCHRLCKDGSEHFGDLELITWKCPTDGTGWGNVFVEEEEYMKKKFTEEFGSDL
ncbi:hypothetical protein F5146DRAFT_426949 [Armillaria mellea]|nr:hypothetical protein F5146DRAFT_426949 [Armillaria mellea]